MLTSSSQHDVRALEAGEGTLVGSHTEVLKDEGTSQEVQVVGVRDKGSCPWSSSLLIDQIVAYLCDPTDMPVVDTSLTM